MGKEVISSIGSLIEQPAFKLTPEILQRLTVILRNRHGVDINIAVFQITREELDNIKLELSTTQNPEYAWEKFLDNEILESKLRTEGISAINLDVVTTGIESSRMEYTRKEFEKLIVPYLDKYDFLDENTKNILKLAIANRLLSNPMSKEVQGGLEKFGVFVKGFENKTHSQTQEVVNQTQAKSSEIESAFLPIFTEYGKIFDSIDKKFKDFENSGIKLTAQEKQAIISNVKFFRSPSLMEKGSASFNISEINPSNRNLNNSFDFDEVKKYINDSREKIGGLSKLFEAGDAASNTIYSLMSSNNEMVSGAMEGFIGFLLKIPIIGKILAIFLGLDPENAIEELKENSENYRLFKSLIDLGRGPNNKEGKGIFKDKDLTPINFNILKGDIKAIKALIPNLKREDYSSFWEKSFGEGYDINGFNFKLELTDEQKSRTRLTTSDMKDIIQNGMDKYKKNQEEQRLKDVEAQRLQRQAEAESRTTSTKAALGSLQLRLDGIGKIADQSYDQIPNWDEVFNVGDINDVTLSSIFNNNSDDFSKLLESEIGKDDYAKLTDENKAFLNQFFIYIREYISSNRSFKIEGDVKTFLKNEKGFFDFIKAKKESLEQERAGAQQQLDSLNSQTELINLQNNVKAKLLSINEETSLSAGIDVGNSTIVRFNSGNQKLIIGNNSYSISVTSSVPGLSKLSLEDIKVLGDKVNFIAVSDNIGGNLILSGYKSAGLIDKSIILGGIMELLDKGSYEYKGESVTLKITKDN